MAASLCAAPPASVSSPSSAGGVSSTRPRGLILPTAIGPSCDEEAIAKTLLSELAEFATSPQSPLMKAVSAWPEFSSVAEGARKECPRATSGATLPPAALRCFLRGTLLLVGDGEWTPAEELKAYYTAEGAKTSEGGIGLRLLHAVLRSNGDDSAGGETTVRVRATFQSVSNGARLIVDCERSHPFLVESKGWASLEPGATTRRYGLTCQPLSLGDVCVPPANQTASAAPARTSFERLYEHGETISEADSKAAQLLSQLALSSTSSYRQGFATAHQVSPVENLKGKSGSFGKKRSAKSKKPPTSLLGDDPPSKRPMNAFMLFAQRHRQQVTKEHPGRDNRAISTILGDHWRQLDKSERVQFVLEARALAEEHQKLYPNCWKRKRPAPNNDVKRPSS